jgi:hypothetical protein
MMNLKFYMDVSNVVPYHQLQPKRINTHLKSVVPT